LHWHRIHRRASARVLNLVTRGFMRRHRQTDRVAADATAPRTSVGPLQRDGDIGRRRLEGGSNRARVSGVWMAEVRAIDVRWHQATSRRFAPTAGDANQSHTDATSPRRTQRHRA